MAHRDIDSGKFMFSIDSSLLFQLGEQLVSRPSIALAELVKNAYDADATRVRVTMEKVGQPGGTILIEDDGHGMTFEEVRNSWMRIATTIKREHPVSRHYCRPLTGAKGVGRFAARRLGDKLTLQSVALRQDGSKESIVVEFDWALDFIAGQDLVEVPVSYTRRDVGIAESTGVSLLVTGARDAWTTDELASLRRDLLSLQSPFPDLIVRSEQHASGCVPDPGFDFELQVESSGELEALSGGLGEAFLNRAWARLDGDVDTAGRSHYQLTVLKTGQRYSLDDVSNDYSGLEHSRLRVYFMVYSSEYFQGGDFGVRDAQRKGREEGGVRVYLDGFRIFPYGDSGDDWLQFDEHAAKNTDLGLALTPPEAVLELSHRLPGRPFLLIPRNNQLFGVVALSQAEHSGIEINITRDRLIETPMVVRLRRFVQTGVYWMTLVYAAQVAEQQAERRERKRLSAAELIDDTITAVNALRSLPEDRRNLVVFNLERAREQARVEEQERISEIAMLRILASAGTTLALMNHQLRALTGAVSQTEQDLRRLQADIPDELQERYQDIIAQVTEWNEMVALQVSQLGFLLSPDSRQRRRRLPLYALVENVRKPMSFYMKKYNVKFVNDVARNLRTPPLYQSEIYAVLINLLSNALKAVHSQPERCIAVEAEQVEGILKIRMKDTGVGLPIERREISFKPFVTTSVPNPILGVGTGLGLKVVRDILELYGGTAHFVDVAEPWVTSIEVVLPDRGGDAGV